MTRGFRAAIAYYLALPFGVVFAMLWANTGSESYFVLAHALGFVVNDIGMVFFLAVMTKEIVEATAPGGALHSWRLRTLPVVAGVGGFIGATLVYEAWLRAGDELSVLARGWPVPSAVDLAFTYFVMKAIFRRHPAVSFVLLMAITIDVLGLLMVELRTPPVDGHAIAAVLMVAAILVATRLRRTHVRDFRPYVAIAGGLSWAAFYVGGLHPVYALVPIVPFIPHAAHDPGFLAESPPEAHDPLNEFERAWQYPMHVVLLCFGLVNGGVVLRELGTGTWSVLVGALVGKPLGIFIAIAGGLAAGLHLPQRLGWRDLMVGAFAASTGLTFALLFSVQAFAIGPVLNEVKIGAVLTGLGSLVALTLARVLTVGRFAEPDR